MCGLHCSRRTKKGGRVTSLLHSNRRSNNGPSTVCRCRACVHQTARLGTRGNRRPSRGRPDTVVGGLDASFTATRLLFPALRVPSIPGVRRATPQPGNTGWRGWRGVGCKDHGRHIPRCVDQHAVPLRRHDTPHARPFAAVPGRLPCDPAAASRLWLCQCAAHVPSPSCRRSRLDHPPPCSSFAGRATADTGHSTARTFLTRRRPTSLTSPVT